MALGAIRLAALRQRVRVQKTLVNRAKLRSQQAEKDYKRKLTKLHEWESEISEEESLVARVRGAKQALKSHRKGKKK